MNKMEIKKGLYRQNVYNINCRNGKYNHFTCYFDDDINIMMIFKAGDNLNMTSFIENTDIKPLELSPEIMQTVKGVLSSWTYSHIKPVELYKGESLWRGIFEITDRDKFVIEKLEQTF